MGIYNAPATFHRAMNMTFQNFVNKTRLAQGMVNFYVIVYMDDILVYSKTYHGHAQHIEGTLGALRDAGFKIAREERVFPLGNFVLGLRRDTWRTAAGLKVAASARAPTLSYRVKENNAPLLSEEKWDTWWEDYVELAFCLLEIEFRWSEAAPFGQGPEHPEDSVEFLIIQAWRTAEQGDLLGIVFGKVEEGNLTLITDELLVFLTQLVDNLPQGILSRGDKQPGTHMLSRTLEPHLVWSTCTEIDEDNYLYPSQALYLEIDVTDLTFWDPIARQNLAQDEEIGGADEEEEEEPSSEERDDPDYVPESEAGIADESSQPREKNEEEG
ncbi:hypothetical protein CBR_g8874 [Chara braunii]|uniref:Reverse transcriptase domain-containing protein n=1 Tax=Chara braunii TaxID=69332 RepID=A0A388KN18_CHABU|nr:hypothetical protein CBR_g8874 [Chara braunii]|eukprot:GBG71456.1 hypothetical protein CBR_g8874 [Chara braunii]